jgi:putative adenylate-forming enzyme
MPSLSGVFSRLTAPFAFLYYFLATQVRFRWLRGKALERYQTRRARAIVQYASQHSKYFRELYAGHDLREVFSLPITNKKMMMENLSDYNTLGATRQALVDFCLEVEKSRDFARRFGEATVAMSSGTSGNKGIEILSRAEENFLRALFLSRFPIPRNAKINLAFILRVSAPAVSLNTFGHRLTYVSQMGSIEEIRARLAALEPNAVSAPPSMLHLLAKEANAGRLALKPLFLISYAEVLYPDVKDIVERAFHCPVYEIYKCTEGVIAIACRHGKLHINEDVVVVQLYDQDGRPTLPGQACHRMIVTDLCKKSQPIIRYELNDLLTLSPDRCACGSAFRVIERIQGRSNDIFLGKRADRETLQFIFPDYISRAIISSSEDIEEYQAIQKSPAEVLVRILPKTDGDRQAICRGVQSNLQGVFAAYQCALPVVTVVFERPVVNPNSIKLIRIHREF